MNKTKKTLAVLAITAIASIGIAGPSSAATNNGATKGGGYTIFKIGDGWCC